TAFPCFGSSIGGCPIGEASFTGSPFARHSVARTPLGAAAAAHSARGDAMWIPATAIPYFGCSADRLKRRFPRLVSRVLWLLHHVDSLSLAQDHRLNIAVLVFVQKRGYGRLALLLLIS